jgi:hypothetical protein
MRLANLGLFWYYTVSTGFGGRRFVVDTTLVPAIKAAIRANELGSASPYCLSYARLGQSGASFGIFQGDTNVNHTTRAVLRQALSTGGSSAADCDRIISAVSKPCPDGNPLSKEDTMLANDALASEAGRALVDAMDAALLQVVLGELDTSIAAAATHDQATIVPAAQLYIALWVNMTGAPNTLNKWLSGSPDMGLLPPIGPLVTRQNIESYLQASTYFRLHPHNFVHMADSVDAGIAAAPG